MLFYVCLVALFALAASSCENTPDEATLRARFCQSQVAFVGQIFGGGSGISRDRNGRETAGTYANLMVIENLKSSVLAPDVTVHRTYVISSPCDKQVFYYNGGTLIMGEFLTPSAATVTPCDVHPGWDCLSDAFKESLRAGDVC